MKCRNCKHLGYGYSIEDTICIGYHEPIEDIDEELIDCVAYEEEEGNEDD